MQTKILKLYNLYSLFEKKNEGLHSTIAGVPQSWFITSYWTSPFREKHNLRYDLMSIEFAEDVRTVFFAGDAVVTDTACNSLLLKEGHDERLAKNRENMDGGERP